MKRYLIAHDLGTSSCKASLFRLDGSVVKSCETGYPTVYPEGIHTAEQDPADWWNAFCETNKKLLEGMDKTQVAAVAVSGQMMACLPVSKTEGALAPCIIWADSRAREESEEIKEKVGLAEYYSIVGNSPSANYSAAKIRWFKRHYPELYEKTDCFIQPKDYITWRLLGRFVTDPTDAGHMHLYNVLKGCWSQEILDAAGIDREKLPEVVDGGTPLGEVSNAMAEECGLAAGTLIVQGAGDGRAAMLGSGVLEPGESYICLGTSSWFTQATLSRDIDKTYGLCKVVSLKKGVLVNSGTMQGGGLCLGWFQDKLCEPETRAAAQMGVSPFVLIDKLAEKSPPGSRGVMFLPYLMGERAPYFDPVAKGCFLGLKMKNDRSDMARAVLEGVAMHLAVIMRRVNAMEPVSQVRIVGGGAKSMLWRQIIADVFGLPIIKTNIDSSAGSLGTAVLAGVGAGIYPDLSVIKDFHKLEDIREPNAANTALYNDLIPIFEKAYYTLKEINADLEAF